MKKTLAKQFYIQNKEDGYNSVLCFDSMADAMSEYINDEMSTDEVVEQGVPIYVAVPVYLGHYRKEEVTRVRKVKPLRKKRAKAKS